jgi:hypothetical protein
MSLLTIVLSSTAWGHDAMWSSPIYMNSLTSEQAIWTTFVQQLFILVTLQYVAHHARKQRHATDGTKDSAPWRTPCVAGCTCAMFATRKATKDQSALILPHLRLEVVHITHISFLSDVSVFLSCVTHHMHQHYPLKVCWGLQKKMITLSEGS